jgi:hypothetical protein
MSEYKKRLAASVRQPNFPEAAIGVVMIAVAAAGGQKDLGREAEAVLIEILGDFGVAEAAREEAAVGGVGRRFDGLATFHAGGAAQPEDKYSNK